VVCSWWKMRAAGVMEVLNVLMIVVLELREEGY
jgi:hypothetical protein